MQCCAAERLFAASALHRVIDRSGLPFLCAFDPSEQRSARLLAVDNAPRISQRRSYFGRQLEVGFENHVLRRQQAATLNPV
jgi:hypothetical protein